MDSRLEHGKKVKWDDWIGRLIGYLGEYEYMHGQEEVDIEYQFSGEPKADNIVYIYGAEKSGMQECIDLLSEELNGRQEYVCYGYSFERTDKGKAALNFQNEFKEAFRAGEPKFQFPCLRLLTAAEEHNEEDGLREILSNILDVSGTLFDSVETLATGNWMKKIFAGKDLVTELWNSKEFLRNMLKGGVEAEAVKRLKERLRDLALRHSVVSAVRAEMPFDCLQMDLQINVKSLKKHVICTVNAFELCQERLADKAHRELLLKAMASVPGIVWVLFSSKMPDDEARSIIKRENFWRMGGISKERTIRLLERECPEGKRRWYKAVYHYTGGLVGLLNLCMDAHKSGHRFVDDRDSKIADILKNAQMLGLTLSPEQIEQLTRMQGEAAEEMVRAEDNKQDKEQDKAQQELGKWFREVWTGRYDDNIFYGDSERERKDPLDFLFGSGRIDFEEMPDDGSDNSVRKYFLPCLCYLVKKSLSNVGTVEQYHWQRRHQSLELNELGTRCLLVVEEDPLFCKEYEEYPGILYLDPIIVQVVSKHRNYEKWLQAFEDKCLQSIELDEHKNPAKDSRFYSAKTFFIVDAQGQVHNLKLAEGSVLESNEGVVQSAQPFVKEEQEKPVPDATGDAAAQSASQAPSDADRVGQTPEAGGMAQPPEVPREENMVEKSYREGNEEQGRPSGGKSDRDKKQMDGNETVLEEKEIIFASDDNNPMGKP